MSTSRSWSRTASRATWASSSGRSGNRWIRTCQQILDLWASWGVQGIKVDFMQRADQQMVNFYEKTAREAARRKLLVDYHGAFKPAGLRRAYPNVINYEGLARAGELQVERGDHAHARRDTAVRPDAGRTDGLTRREPWTTPTRTISWLASRVP